jgi:hypothetical protein
VTTEIRRPSTYSYEGSDPLTDNGIASFTWLNQVSSPMNFCDGNINSATYYTWQDNYDGPSDPDNPVSNAYSSYVQYAGWGAASAKYSALEIWVRAAYLYYHADCMFFISIDGGASWPYTVWSNPWNHLPGGTIITDGASVSVPANTDLSLLRVKHVLFAHDSIVGGQETTLVYDVWSVGTLIPPPSGGMFLTF